MKKTNFAAVIAWALAMAMIIIPSTNFAAETTAPSWAQSSTNVFYTSEGSNVTDPEELSGSVQSDVYLTIEQGALTISAWVEKIFLTKDGDPVASDGHNNWKPASVPQEVHGTFGFTTITGANGESIKKYPFVVTDFKGSEKGYYTTIQVSPLKVLNSAGEYDDDLIATNPAYKIDADNVSFKHGTLTKMQGVDNSEVKFGDELANLYPISGAVTYFLRDEWTTAGLLGEYGDDKPSISVNIPANTPAGTYKGTITYTLFDNAD